MRQAWQDGVVSFDGKHYQVDGAIVAPQPLQQGGLPLWIAGGGEKVTLRIAAQYAQYTNFASAPDVFENKSEILAGHCRDVGTDFDAIVRSSNVNVVIGDLMPTSRTGSSGCGHDSAAWPVMRPPTR